MPRWGRSTWTPRLVIALPFKVLRDVEITPKFSPEKMDVLNTLGYPGETGQRAGGRHHDQEQDSWEHVS